LPWWTSQATARSTGDRKRGLAVAVWGLIIIAVLAASAHDNTAGTTLRGLARHSPGGRVNITEFLTDLQARLPSRCPG
jgi:hypothetical protein